jgi:hypothetical protein
MKRRLLFLTISAAVLGLSVGCLYPDHGERRGERPDQRHDQGHDENRGRDNDREHDKGHDEGHGQLSQPALTQ